jgi:hypothetical protein
MRHEGASAERAGVVLRSERLFGAGAEQFQPMDPDVGL